MSRDEYWKREQAVLDFHHRIDRGKFRGLCCFCDYEFSKMMAFKEAYDKWLS